MPARKYLYLFLALLGLLVTQPSFAQQRVLPRGVPNVPSLPPNGPSDVGPEPRAVLYKMKQRPDVFPLNSANPLDTVRGMFELWPFTPIYDPKTKAPLQFGGWINETGPRFLFMYKGQRQGARVETPTFADFAQVVAAIQSLGPDDTLFMRVRTSGGEETRYVRAPSNHPYNNTYDRFYLLIEKGAITKGALTAKTPLSGDDLVAVRTVTFNLEEFQRDLADRTTEYVRNYGNTHEYHVLILRLPPKKEAKAAPAPAEPGA